MISLQEAEDQLAFRQPFTVGNLSANWHVMESGQMVYKVYSYLAEIARIDENGITLNPKKYSVTTSKHLNIVKRAWELN